MTTVPTSQLQGAALDWAVAKCEALPVALHSTGAIYLIDTPWGDKTLVKWLAEFSPTRHWAQGGPIIERELIDIQAKFNSGSSIAPKGQWYWQASTVNEDDVAYWLDGATPLIAAMRCYVASKLGDDVDVPEGLA